MAAKTPNAAIFYADDAYLTDKPKLMGRQSAGEGFLRGFVRHSHVEELRCVTSGRRAAEHFAQQCRRFGAGERPISWTPAFSLSAIAEQGTLYLPGPMLAEMSWRRQRGDPKAFSLFGLTHTIASDGAMDSIASMLTAPVEPWDALICTSSAVLDATTRLLQAEGERLAARFGGTMPRMPTLAMVPLGVDTEELKPSETARARWRKSLEIEEGHVAFLFVGRLSFHAKANPYPMFIAAERAATSTGKGVHFILAGWFANEAIESTFRKSALALCPHVTCHFLDGRDSAVRSEIWSAADIFISLSDNIQETFGLTPIEAMAAGLPCVVSDWDGYKDTVRHGEDGFRIPTACPAPGMGQDLMVRYEEGIDNYDRYIGFSSLLVAVDIEATIEACTKLVGDASLRRRMGENGRARAVETFDWSVVIGRYQDIWGELALLRNASAESVRSTIPNPRRADPFWLFASYPSDTLRSDTLVEIADHPLDHSISYVLQECPVTNYAQAMLPTLVELESALRLLKDQGSMTASEIGVAVDGKNPGRVIRALAFLAKVGLVRLSAGGWRNFSGNEVASPN